MTPEAAHPGPDPGGPRVVEGRAFARAGLLGNPSDGYGGRTLSVVVRNFDAQVTLEASTRVIVEGRGSPPQVYRCPDHLRESVTLAGYRGEAGARLILATIKVFLDHCRERGIALEEGGFTARYRTSIPRQVGLAGSSAIATAAFRALMAFHRVEIAREVQVSLIMSAEVDELGGVAGPQDRVIQVFEGLVYMDFDLDLATEGGLGRFEPMNPALLPPLYLAYWAEGAAPSREVHGDLRARWEVGEPGLGEAMDRIAALATRGREALLAGDHGSLARLMDENFDLRRRIMDVAERDVGLVERARALGASAKLPGSGGAVVGTVVDEAMLGEVAAALQEMGAVVVEPRVVGEEGGE